MPHDADPSLIPSRLAPARARAIAAALRTGAPCSPAEAASLLDDLERAAILRARQVVALLSKGDYAQARVLLDLGTGTQP